MESTSFCSWHIANTLSINDALAWFKPKTYCLDLKVICAYKKSFVDIDKTDPKYAFVIADFARVSVSKITTAPRSGCQYIALQRLTKYRLYLMENINLEKSCIISNIFLKLSELAVLDNSQNPFSNTFNASSLKTLTEFMTIEDLTNSKLEDLIVFLLKR